MKKKFMALLVVLCFLTAGTLFAQDWVNYSPAYQPGDIAVQAGVGFISTGGYYGDTTIPPVSVSVDYALPIGDLPFSFGAFAGYSASEEEYSYWTYNWTYEYSYILVGARAAYHVDLGIPNLDTYTGVMLGYNIVNATVSGDTFGSTSEGSSYFLYGGYVGARYFFTENLAAFGELGYGLGLITLGATYKL